MPAFVQRVAGVFSRNVEGAAVMVFGLAFVPVMLMMAAAIDYGRVVSTRSEMQNDLDAALLAGVKRSAADQATIAQNVFHARFKGHGATVAVLDFKPGAESGTLVGTVSATVPTSFMQIAGFKSVSIAAAGTAKYVPARPSGPCFNLLDPDIWYGLRLEEASALAASSCEMHVHSGRSDASAGFKDVSGVQLKRVCLRGGAKTSVPNMEQFCAVAANSYSGKMPSVVVGSCTHNNATFSAATSVLTPGVYCGDTTLASTVDNATLQPGLYVFKGALTINAKNVLGAGVTLFFATSDGALDAENVDSMTLSAPTTGAYRDILIFQPNGLDNSDAQFRSVHTLNWTGIVYTPAWDYRIETANNWKLKIALVGNAMEIRSISNWSAEPLSASKEDVATGPKLMQ